VGNKLAGNAIAQLNQGSVALAQKVIHCPELGPVRMVNNFPPRRIAESST
jgi:hypothetical protein